MDFLEKGAKFVKECKPEETAVVYHGNCGDGIASAAILARTIKQLFGTIPHIAPYNYTDTFSELEEKLRAIKPKNVIFVDTSIDKFIEEVKLLSAKYKIAIFDHHPHTNNLNEIGVLHIHPSFFWEGNPSLYVGAKLTYDVCNLAVNISDLSWLAVAGLVHDVASGEHVWTEFMDEEFEKHPVLKGVENPYGYQGKIKELVGLLTVGKAGPQFEKLALRACLEADGPESLMSGKVDKQLVIIRNEISKEMSDYAIHWRDRAEIDETLKLVWYELNSKFDIGSVVTGLAIKNPDYVFVAVQESGDLLKYSFRCHSKRVDCNKLVKKATEGIGSGGGHIPAAGAQVPKDNAAEFKKRIFSRLTQSEYVL